MTKKYILTADDVVDNLTSTDQSVPLSANQGSVLAGRVTTVEGKTANATTSSKGIVQVGSGLSVTDGVISVSGGSSVYCPNISTSNNSGFLIGSCTTTTLAVSEMSASISKSQGWAVVGTEFRPLSLSFVEYPPFEYTPSVATTFTLSASITGGRWEGDSGVLEIRRVSDGTVLGTTSAFWEASLSVSVSIPSDWDYTSDRLQAYGKSTYSSTFTFKVSLTGGTSTTQSIYYNPTAGS